MPALKRHIKRVALFFFNISPSIASSLYSRCSEKQFSVKPKGELDTGKFWRSWQGLLLVASTAYLLLGSLRLLACGPVLYYGADRFAGYLRHDPIFWTALYTTRLVNPLTAVCGPPFPLFLVYLDYLMKVRRFNYIWAPVYELLVLNGRHFGALNRGLLPKGVVLDLGRPMRSLRSLVAFARWFMASGKRPNSLIRFSVRRFTHCSPYLSTGTRLQAVAVTAVGQALLAAALFGLVTLMPPFGAAYVYLLVLPAVQSVPGAVLLAIDCLFIYLCTVNAIATLLFLVHTFTVVQFVAHQHVRLMVGGLRRKVREYTRARKSSSVEVIESAHHHHGRYLLQLAGEHCRFLVSVVHANRLIFSPLSLFAACSNFLSNLYLLSAAYQLEHLDGANRAASLALAGVQCAAFLLLFTPSLAHIRDLYRLGGPFAGALVHWGAVVNKAKKKLTKK